MDGGRHGPLGRAARLLRVGGAEQDRLQQQVDRLRDLNTALGERIVALEAQRADRPHDGTPDPEFLFVLTYGRSGSTLLQGVLNVVPGYLIRGENRGVLHHLQDFHAALAAARDDFGPAALPAHPWFGVGGYRDDEALAAIRRLVLDLVLRPGPDTRVTGYKEIRWSEHDTAAGRDLAAHVDFVRQVFPGARFVVNTRDLERASVSGFWKDRPEARVRLERMDADIQDQAELLGDYAFRVRYDDYAGDPAALAGLFDWLGEPFDLALVERVLGQRHSY